MGRLGPVAIKAPTIVAPECNMLHSGGGSLERNLCNSEVAEIGGWHSPGTNPAQPGTAGTNRTAGEGIGPGFAPGVRPLSPTWGASSTRGRISIQPLDSGANGGARGVVLCGEAPVEAVLPQRGPVLCPGAIPYWTGCRSWPPSPVANSAHSAMSARRFSK